MYMTVQTESMVDYILTGGTVLTMDGARRVIPDGAVAVDGREIVAVGPAADVTETHSADRVIDTAGQVVLPGFISSHVHVSDILLRGGINTDRSVNDWMYNVKAPGVAAMTPADHEIASALYSLEALQSGITTFVENAGGTGSGYADPIIETKMDVYETSGVRHIYAHAIADRLPDEDTRTYLETLMRREPSVEHVFPDTVDTDTAIERTESLIETYHKGPEGRQSVWPAPYFTSGVTPDGFTRAYELAEKYNVMTTTHAAESPGERVNGFRPIEFLDHVGYLGPRTVLAHCVHLTDTDIRVLCKSGAAVSHNPLTNLALGDGIGPVPEMLRKGIPVGLGTDNTSGSDTVNMLNDMRFGALIHKGSGEDAGAITAETVLEMATIGNARVIGREDDLGSIEPGKLADLVVLDCEQPHLTPAHDIASAIVYQAQGFEVETVFCDGELVMYDRTVEPIEQEYPALASQAQSRSEEIIKRAGLDTLRGRRWHSIADWNR